MTWNAINVEDRARAVCETAEPTKKTAQIGAFINDAIKALDGLPEDPPVIAALDWLNEARAALGERNQVLH
jgi:hypothetical protein